MPAADACPALRPGADKSKEQPGAEGGDDHAGEIGESQMEGKEEVAFL